MDATKRLRGIELRYVLTATVAKQGVMSVEDLAFELARRGFSVNGRPSKVISDALRWEVGLGRVTRCGRGNYGPGAMPRSTESRIWQRYMNLREEAALLTESWPADEDGGDLGGT